MWGGRGGTWDAGGGARQPVSLAWRVRLAHRKDGRRGAFCLGERWRRPSGDARASRRRTSSPRAHAHTAYLTRPPAADPLRVRPPQRAEQGQCAHGFTRWHGSTRWHCSPRRALRRPQAASCAAPSARPGCVLHACRHAAAPPPRRRALRPPPALGGHQPPGSSRQRSPRALRARPRRTSRLAPAPARAPGRSAGGWSPRGWRQPGSFLRAPRRCHRH